MEIDIQNPPGVYLSGGFDFLEKTMNKNHLQHIVGTLAILLAIVACVLPGQAVQPPTIQPTPAVDTNAIATAVASTAQVAATQTASSQLFGTSVPAGMRGTTVEQLKDGTTKYSDYDGGFEVVFPAGWLVLIPGSEEFNTALEKKGAANPALQDQMTLDQSNYNAEFDQIYAYALRPDIKKNVIFGFSKLAWDVEDGLSIDNITMGELVQELESPGGIPGFRADNAQLREDTSVKMIEIGGRWTKSNTQGDPIVLYSTAVFFKPSDHSTVRILFTILEDFHAQIMPDVKSVLASIKIIGPQQ